MSRQPVDTTRIMAGLLDLLAASQVASAELGRSPTSSETRIFRILGARQILQGVITAHWAIAGPVSSWTSSTVSR